jgi:hypothetical protein
LAAIRDGLTDGVVATLLNAKSDATTKRKAASEDAEKVFDKALASGLSD